MNLPVLHCTTEHELWCNNSHLENPLFLDLWHYAYSLLPLKYWIVIACCCILLFIVSIPYYNWNGECSKLMNFDNLNWHIYCKVPVILETPNSYRSAPFNAHLQDVDSGFNLEETNCESVIMSKGITI